MGQHILLALLLLLGAGVSALSRQVVTFENTGFVLAGPNFALDIILDAHDPAAVHIAARSFADDVQRITGSQPRLRNGTAGSVGDENHQAIVVGTIGSKLIRQVERARWSGTDGQKVISSPESLKGKWESYEVEVVDRPLKGLNDALVVTGSDRVGRAIPHISYPSTFVAQNRYPTVVLLLLRANIIKSKDTSASKLTSARSHLRSVHSDRAIRYLPLHPLLQHPRSVTRLPLFSTQW